MRKIILLALVMIVPADLGAAQNIQGIEHLVAEECRAPNERRNYENLVQKCLAAGMPMDYSIGGPSGALNKMSGFGRYPRAAAFCNALDLWADVCGFPKSGSLSQQPQRQQPRPQQQTVAPEQIKRPTALNERRQQACLSPDECFDAPLGLPTETDSLQTRAEKICAMTVLGKPNEPAFAGAGGNAEACIRDRINVDAMLGKHETFVSQMPRSQAPIQRAGGQQQGTPSFSETSSRGTPIESCVGKITIQRPEAKSKCEAFAGNNWAVEFKSTCRNKAYVKFRASYFSYVAVPQSTKEITITKTVPPEGAREEHLSICTDQPQVELIEVQTLRN